MQKYLLFLIATFMLVVCKNVSNAAENKAADVDEDFDEQWDYSESDFGLYGSLPEGTTEFVGKMGNTPIELAITKFGYDDTLEAAFREVGKGVSDMFVGESLPAMDGDINFLSKYDYDKRSFNLTGSKDKIEGTAYIRDEKYRVTLLPKPADAATYSDRAFFDLYGPVKSARVFLNLHNRKEIDLRFGENGRLESYRDTDSAYGITLFSNDSDMQRDQSRNIDSFHITLGDFESYLDTFTFDKNSKITRYKYSMGGDFGGNIQYIRNVKGHVVKEIFSSWEWYISSEKQMNWREVYTYIITKTDSYGNWIERKWTHTGKGRTKSGIDRRTITYY